MQKRTVTFLQLGLIIVLVGLLAGCRLPSSQETSAPTLTTGVTIPAPTASETATQVALASPAHPITQVFTPPIPTTTAPGTQSAYPFPQPTGPSGYPAPVEGTATPYPAPQASATPLPPRSPTASPAQPVKSATSTVTGAAQPTEPAAATVTSTTIGQYPGPQATSTSRYPGPQETETQPYPGPRATPTTRPTFPGITATPRRTQPGSRSPTPTRPGGTAFPSPTAVIRTGTPGGTPTELPPAQPLAPPPAGSNVSIWYSWSTAETNMLRDITQSFQRLYPDVTFQLTFVPLDDLLTTYQEAAYLGQGPSLLLGPAQWGPVLFDGQLITDLSSYVPGNYLTTINPAALASGRYEGALISLPLSQHGVVMYRNTSLVATAPATFEELTSLSLAATRAGNVGSYLERGAYFSAAGLLGLGGTLMDENNQPQFNNLPGLEWFKMLEAYDQAGAVTFNTNRDLDMFKRSKVGIIIDGTWNSAALSQALGAGKLAIDPWPTFGSGHLSGWVEADSVFLNSNLVGDDRFAALAFVGYLLDPNVQLRLAEVGHIPSVTTTRPRDPLVQQAMAAFSDGVPYPIAVDQAILNVYWSRLDSAIRAVFVSGVSPEAALKSASETITEILVNSTSSP